MKRMIPLITVAILLSATGVLSPAPPDDPREALRKAVSEHLAAGRIEAALEAAQRALAEHPDDASVREEFVSLHLSLARQMLTEEKFAIAERALDAVLKTVPDHAEARRLIAGIQAARDSAPRQVEEARRWLELEWFEPAFNTLRQAIALLPQRKGDWLEFFQTAASGAGDDHYYCKDFHEAFFFYDAALETGVPGNARSHREITARWLQSMIHALGKDVDRANYPPAYWKTLLGRAEAAKPAGEEGTSLIKMLQGLAYENTGDLERAAAAYAAVLGKAAEPGRGEHAREDRLAAIGVVRKFYDSDLGGRRHGLWAKSETGDWQTLETARFRIHHRNAQAARRVADALEFHFDRLAAFLGQPAEGIPWAKPCDIYLHKDQTAFRKATSQRADVNAVSVIRRSGSKLESHEIHLQQADPMLLSTSLPHELAHLMTAALVEYQPIAAAVSEGLALYAEPRCRELQFARLFAELNQPRDIDALLKVPDTHPTDPAFYAEARRLVHVLLAHGNAAGVLRSSILPVDSRRLAESSGFKDSAELAGEYRGLKLPVTEPPAARKKD